MTCRMRDIQKNRRDRKWSRSELIRRAAWALVQPIFYASPRIFWGWRRLLLRSFGAQIDDCVHIHPSVRIDIPWNLKVGRDSAVGEGVRLYNLGPLVIGTRVTISQHAHLCGGSHDDTRIDFPLVKSPITIGDDAWICADSFVGPGVVVGQGAIIGARAVVMRDVAENSVMAGNPAKVIRARKSRLDPSNSRAVPTLTKDAGLLE
jgi:putative colanic acid biosynthesis acetyltransferase WcaF